jgi:hypothetical protein
MKKFGFWLAISLALLICSLGPGKGAALAQNTNPVQVLGTNDSGMHCIDSDYSIWQILPPGNQQRVQVVRKATARGTTPRILANTDVSVFYRAIADPAGSINTTSIGKTNFWRFVNALFGISLPLNTGFQGQKMPGGARRLLVNSPSNPLGQGPVQIPVQVNDPQLFTGFEAASKHFAAPGIPITPIDDAARVNNYPLFQLEARNTAGGALMGSLSSVVPVSSETHCSDCHATGQDAASPGFHGIQRWSTNPNIDLQTRNNILRLHDRLNGTRLRFNRPVNCSDCHYSAANDVLKNGQVTTTNLNPPNSLSAVMHTRHGTAVNGTVPIPDQGIATCYRCHPGRTTNCFRGAMFEAGLVCQNCHGNLLAVGGQFPLATTGQRRRPWVDLPACQSCHTGDVLNHQGADIILRMAFTPGDPSATPRQATNARFAEQPGILYKDSLGHQDIACENCHGAPHAEWPTNVVNDNLAATQIQGHSGMIIECTACHGNTLSPTLDGPHGMHPVNDRRWIEGHENFFEQNADNCKTCHGTMLEGTVLSKAAVARTFALEERTVNIPKGRPVGCCLCHENPLFN